MSEKLREQFEAWYLDHPLHTSFERDGDGYKSIGADVAWEAYQAGHAVNADLLEALEHNLNDHDNYKINVFQLILNLREAIKKARAE